MSNMSYCRFQNTSSDLKDCKNALEELTNDRTGKLSNDELQAAKRLVRTCLDIVRLLDDARMLSDSILIDIDDAGGVQHFENSYASIIEDANAEAEE